jgi:hypothetical protein
MVLYMNRCQEDVIISNGCYIHSEQEAPPIQIKYRVPNALRATGHEDEREFHTLFVILKNEKHHIFPIFHND